VIIDCYNTAQNERGRSDYLTGARPGEAPPPHVPFDPNALLERMDAAGVDLAMVCSLAQRIENDFLVDLVGKHPQRLFAFGQVRPQDDDALDEIARCADAGMRGLKLHPTPDAARLPVLRPRPARPGVSGVRGARADRAGQRAGRPVLLAARDRGDREGAPGGADDPPNATPTSTSTRPRRCSPTSAAPTAGSARTRSSWAPSGPGTTSTWNA
jgi:hypothetical protein